MPETLTLEQHEALDAYLERLEYRTGVTWHKARAYRMRTIVREGNGRKVYVLCEGGLRVEVYAWLSGQHVEFEARSLYWTGERWKKG